MTETQEYELADGVKTYTAPGIGRLETGDVIELSEESAAEHDPLVPANSNDSEEPESEEAEA